MILECLLGALRTNQILLNVYDDGSAEKSWLLSKPFLSSKNPFKKLSTPYPTLAVTLGYLRGLEIHNLRLGDMPSIRIDDMPML